MADELVSEKTAGPSPGGENYLTHAGGVMSWLGTLDHKRIGVMYLVSILFSFLLGGVFAMLIRTVLLTSGSKLLSATAYNQVFTIHGAIMIFMVLIPGIPAALGNFVLPLMLGAKDVAFPRLNLIGYYMYLAGVAFTVISLVTNSLDTGWTFYTPYSTTTSTVVTPVLFGVFLLGFSSIFTGINFVVSIHMLRPPGMTWMKMPLFLWSLYATAIIQILATPVLGITLLLLILERLLHVGIFDPALGGDPVLYQHFFWFYSHPAVYIMILPAMGVISEVVSIHSRKHIFGYSFIAASSVAIALIGFLVWGHHMFVSGQSSVANVIFSGLTFAVAIPSAVKVFNWLATMYKGSIQLNAPMIYALIFIVLFGIGGLTGLFLGSLAVDVHLHDTYFVVAHFHYVMMGGAMIGFIAGLHHWWPKITGRMYSERWSTLSAALVFIGFNVTFFTQFVMGTQGMPRRYYHYLPKYHIYHLISTYGSYVLAVGFVIMAVYLVHSLFRGRRAPANPWGGNSLEWHCASPPPFDNFSETPEASDPYDYSRVVYDRASGGYLPRPAQPGQVLP